MLVIDFNSIKTAMLTQKDAEFEIYDFNTVFLVVKSYSSYAEALSNMIHLLHK